MTLYEWACESPQYALSNITEHVLQSRTRGMLASPSLSAAILYQHMLASPSLSAAILYQHVKAARLAAN